MTPIHLVRTPSPGLPSSVADPHRPRPCCTTASYCAPQTCDCRHKLQIRAGWFVAHIFDILRCFTSAALLHMQGWLGSAWKERRRRRKQLLQEDSKSGSNSVSAASGCVAKRLRHSLFRRSPAHMSNGGADGTSSSGRPSTEEWSFADEPSGKPRESCVKYFDALWFCYCESAAFTAPFSTIVLFMRPWHCGKSAAAKCSHHASSQAEDSMAVKQKT